MTAGNEDVNGQRIVLPPHFLDGCQDPFLEIHDGNGAVIISNDNWRETQANEINQTGLAPNDDRESAAVITLPSGAYTTIVKGVNDTVGVGLVEAYDVQYSQ